MSIVTVSFEHVWLSVFRVVSWLSPSRAVCMQVSRQLSCLSLWGLSWVTPRGTGSRGLYHAVVRPSKFSPALCLPGPLRNSVSSQRRTRGHASSLPFRQSARSESVAACRSGAPLASGAILCTRDTQIETTSPLRNLPLVGNALALWLQFCSLFTPLADISIPGASRPILPLGAALHSKDRKVHRRDTPAPRSRCSDSMGFHLPQNKMASWLFTAKLTVRLGFRLTPALTACNRRRIKPTAICAATPTYSVLIESFMSAVSGRHAGTLAINLAYVRRLPTMASTNDASRSRLWRFTLPSFSRKVNSSMYRERCLGLA